MDFSTIKNEKLKGVLAESQTFSNLDPLKQKEFLVALSLIEDTKGEELCEFFRRQNEIEKMEFNDFIREQARFVEEISEKAFEAQKNLNRFLLNRNETRSKKSDESKIQNLINELTE